MSFKKEWKQIVLILVYIIFLFAPLLVINGQVKNYVFFIFNWDFAVFSLILVLFLLIGLLVLGLPIFVKNKGYSYFASLVYGVTFLFIKDIGGYFISGEYAFTSEIGIYFITGLFFINVILLHKEVMDAFSFTIKDITEIAVFIALAIILDSEFLKFRIVPNGGSVSFAMVPLFIIAMRKGFYKGFIACGVIYGAINCLRDGWGLYSFPFDYLLAFGAIGIIGLFQKQIFNDQGKLTFKSCLFLSLGILLSLVGRLLSATISGILFYQTPFIPSMIYQLTYLGPTSIIVFASMFLLYKPLIMLQRLFPNK